MDAFSVPAVFMAKPGLLGRLFGRNRQGSLSLQPDGTFTMTGYDKVYTADDVYEVRAWETGFIDIPFASRAGRTGRITRLWPPLMKRRGRSVS